MKQKLTRVLNYIEQHLENDLSLVQLSQQANLSKYHFHRCFSATYSISVIKYVQLLRLKKAGQALAYRLDKNILEIALSSGFESQEGFSKAFKKLTGQTPIEFRKSPNWVSWEELQLPLNQMKDERMLDNELTPAVEIVTFKAVKVAVMDHIGAPHLIGNTIREFIQWRKDHKLPPSKYRTFNLLYDDPEVTMPEAYRFGLAVQIKKEVSQNERIHLTTIPSLRCAKISHQGSDDELGEMVSYLYKTWLENSGEYPADFPIFFERIRFFPDVPAHQAHTDIYLPLL